jgi:hypothetical protein
MLSLLKSLFQVGYGVVGSIPALASPVGVALCLVLSGGTFIYAACAPHWKRGWNTNRPWLRSTEIPVELRMGRCLHILPEALAVADKGAHSHRVSRQQVSLGAP